MLQPERNTNIPITTIKPASKGFDLDLLNAWRHRELLYFLVWRDLKVRYKQTAIGAGWAIMQPLLAMAIFMVVFQRLARLPSGGLPGPVFYYSGLLLWLYFAGAVSSSTGALAHNQGIITKVYFPRILLPAASVLTGIVDFAVAFVVLIALMLIEGLVPAMTLVMTPLFLLLACAAAFAVGLWLSSANALYRDVGHAIPFLIQLWLFLSPVAYPASFIPDEWRWLLTVNPMAGPIEGFRWALTAEGPAPLGLIASSAGISIVLIFGGLYFFSRTESLVVDVV